MQISIVTPYTTKKYEVAWLEVNTSVGNFVIQSGHAPTIFNLAVNQPVILAFENGKQETFTITGIGILKINREEAMLLLSE